MSGRQVRRETVDGLLVAALAGGATQEAAAREAGVSARTLHRRFQDPEFVRAVQQARERVVGEGLGVVCSNFRAAIDKLVELANHENPRVAGTFSKYLVDVTLRSRSEVLADRVAVLEARLAQIEEEDR